MDVDQEIARLFAEQDKPKLKVSGGIDVDDQGKPNGAHVDVVWNEQRETATE